MIEIISHFLNLLHFDKSLISESVFIYPDSQENKNFADFWKKFSDFVCKKIID